MKTKRYFAYGSNMNVEQMGLRCPEAEVVGIGTLEGYTLKERTHADVDFTGKSGDRVWGVIWEITEDCLKALDSYEGFPRYYTRMNVPVVDDGGQIMECIVYEMTPRMKRERVGQYGSYYRMVCHVGAVENGLPVSEYIPT